MGYIASDALTLIKRKDRVPSEIERLEGCNSQLEQEFDRQASKPLSALEGAKKEHSEKYNQSIKRDLESAEVKLRESQKKKAELAVVVAKQNISDAELQHISSTRAQLERSSSAAQAKPSQLKEAMLDLENKAVKPGLIPRAPEPSEHLDFIQTVNSGAADPALIQLKKNAINHRLGLADQVLLVEETLANLTETLQEKRENLQILKNLSPT
ncbi:kinetochore-associated Ndc80 complex subunit ndc80 [Puccinia graminis f. sp. tritici]|uniref:Kinetochore-associated Ndc80 complex subunit ndc80 n=1 Tax=Puccinia graminis f. sp. tritici TaxID=56615 RepID=A0A5B0REY7_PUCGR|nr:kinetochore-associated Ndc80 complex subunit ndc80 [Puccinia graminis f. sp. tritici]